MKAARHGWTLACLPLALAPACGGGGGGGAGGSGGTGGGGGGSSSAPFAVSSVDHGFGPLLPHRVRELDAQGQPTLQIVSIDSLDDLLANVSPINRLLPNTGWPTSSVLPDGSPGNHYVAVRFTEAPAAASIFLGDALSGAVSLTAYDPSDGSISSLPVCAFLGGRAPLANGELDTQVVAEPSGQLVALQPAAEGFPGTEGASFAGADELVDPAVLVLVAAADGDLSTHERFPSNVQIRLRIEQGVTSADGEFLTHSAFASATVGGDEVRPEVLTNAPPVSTPMITPANGSIDVDPSAPVRIEFTEPVDLMSLGALQGSQAPVLSSAVQLSLGGVPSGIPFSILPVSPMDLGRVELRPSFPLPGQGPPGFSCAGLGDVTVTVQAAQTRDLAGNANVIGHTSSFSTGEGTGLVNAPIAPDAIYIGRAGDTAISVADLYGFGAGTGNPNFAPGLGVEGNSVFPLDPNLLLPLVPSLSPGVCTLDGGGSGPLTLARSSNLDDRLVRSPVVQSVSDMALGHSLDVLMNNGGCQSGPSNPCATTGFKRIAVALGGQHTLAPSLPGQSPIHIVQGGENPISFSPHPNPPPLQFPPPCESPYIPAQEPTSITMLSTSLLGPGGNPFGTPPTGLLSDEEHVFFVGPSPAGTDVGNCQTFWLRQQLGHFLYVADRVADEVVVLNSNRFTVIERIPVPDPVDFAMGPNLDYLAVTSGTTGAVYFIDVDPVSPGFHSIAEITLVGKGPAGIAWQPDNEDILVANELDGTLSILSAQSLKVRKTVSSGLSQPFDVAALPRQTGFGLLRGVYFAFVLDRDGSVSLFESGPDGVGGIGFDDLVAELPFDFQNPKGLQIDHRNLNGGVWIAHEGELDPQGQSTGQPGGALSRMVIAGGATGPQILDQGQFLNPVARELDIQVDVSIGPDQLSGTPSDLAFDNMKNLGALPNPTTSFSAGTGAVLNGKHPVRFIGAGAIHTNEPNYMFVACPDAGVVDVIDLDSGHVRIDVNPYQPGKQSIAAPGATVLMDYFRQ